MTLFDFFFGGLWVFAALGEGLLRAGRAAVTRGERPRAKEEQPEAGARRG